MKLIIVLLVTLVIAGLAFTSCSSLGSRPGDSDKKEYEKSKQFNADKGTFDNRIPGLIQKMWKRNMNWGIVKTYFNKGVDKIPTEPLPEMKPDLEEFMKESDELKVIWFGHSSFLLNVEGKIVLVDPVFSEAASPVNFIVKRFQKPVLNLVDLPEVDFVVISHDHYDHLDMESIKFFKDKKTKFITPLGVGVHIKGWGIAADRVIEKDWWQSESFEGIKFTAAPAQHFSGRDMIHNNETLWASWIIKSEKHNIYFSGDSGYDQHFKEIGEKYGPFDIAFIESGQYDKKWQEVHMLPDESLKAFHDLKAKKYFPVHWGMFELSTHSWYDPVEQLFKLAEGENILTPKIGQLVTVNDEVKFEKWWRPFLPSKASNKVSFVRE